MLNETQDLLVWATIDGMKEQSLIQISGSAILQDTGQNPN